MGGTVSGGLAAGGHKRKRNLDRLKIERKVGGKKKTKMLPV